MLNLSKFEIFDDVLLVIFIVDINFVVAKKFCFCFAGVPLRVRGERLQELPRQGASLSGKPKLFPDLVTNFRKQNIFLSKLFYGRELRLECNCKMN